MPPELTHVRKPQVISLFVTQIAQNPDNNVAGYIPAPVDALPHHQGASEWTQETIIKVTIRSFRIADIHRFQRTKNSAHAAFVSGAGRPPAVITAEVSTPIENAYLPG